MSQNTEDENTRADKAVFLVIASTSTQADLMENLLDNNDIPVLRKRRDSGAYPAVVLGSTRLGEYLYVPSSKFRQAKNIIDAYFKENYKGQEDEKY